MLVKVFENDDIVVDYNKDTKKYRVSIFEDYHFKDEFWFDAYEEKCVSAQEAIRNHIYAVPVNITYEDIKCALDEMGDFNNVIGKAVAALNEA